MCVPAQKLPNLNTSRFGIDVGHIWPHWAGGPAIIQNVLPMSKDVNNQWDEGLVSLRNKWGLAHHPTGGTGHKMAVR